MLSSPRHRTVLHRLAVLSANFNSLGRDGDRLVR